MTSIPPFAKVLIANRGEIAVRIARTCHELGIGVVAVYSDADRTALHVRVADEAYRIGPPPVRESYLKIEAILDVAARSGAEAVHPGYGFLSENAEFAERVQGAGMTFIGPPASAIREMGDKAGAKRLMIAAGVPVVPGYQELDQSDERLRREAARIGYPLMVKAAAGGGGRGLREVREAADFQDQLEGARREAMAAFGDDRVLLERRVADAHHVEVQVFADGAGNVVYLGERDCSVQRRHQKVIEESPSPVVDEDLRRRMGEDAVRAVVRVGYTNAGTVEFLVGRNGDYYFLEMNTRLQVEHPVTEAVTGLDLVRLQLDVAAGKQLPFTQEEVSISGHAIEARLYAEDPFMDFLPSAGRLTRYRMPSGDGIRVDTGYVQGGMVTPYYDSMLAKIIVNASDRGDAIRRLSYALAGTSISGVATNLPMLRIFAASPAFGAGDASTDYLDQNWPALAAEKSIALDVAAGATGFLLTDADQVADGFLDPWRRAVPWRVGTAARVVPLIIDDRKILVTVRLGSATGNWLLSVAGEEVDAAFDRISGTELTMRFRDTVERCTRTVMNGGAQKLVLHDREHLVRLAWPNSPDAAAASVQVGGGGGLLSSPMPGVIAKLNVQEGDTVKERQTLAVLEAMKMEHAIQATFDGRVKRVHCEQGERVAGGTVLFELEPADAE